MVYAQACYDGVVQLMEALCSVQMHDCGGNWWLFTAPPPSVLSSLLSCLSLALSLALL